MVPVTAIETDTSAAAFHPGYLETEYDATVKGPATTQPANK